MFLIADAEGEMISFSSDEELIEALGHVTDGVLRVYVELDRDVTPNPHPQPHQLIRGLSDLLTGLGHCGDGRQGSASSGSGKTDSADSRSERPEQAEEREKVENEETCHDEGQGVRSLFVDTANAFLEPLG